MPKKPYRTPELAPLASTDPRALATKVDALEVTIETLKGQYEAAKGFLLEAERRSADLRKAVRAAVLELRRGTLERGELADALEAALLPPGAYVHTDAELAQEDATKAQQTGEGLGVSK